MKELELTFPGGFKTKTKINGFEIVTDYPIDLGGNLTVGLIIILQNMMYILLIILSMLTKRL